MPFGIDLWHVDSQPVDAGGKLRSGFPLERYHFCLDPFCEVVVRVCVRQFMIEKMAGSLLLVRPSLSKSCRLPLRTVVKAQPFPYSVTQAKPNSRRL
jgi:hypothetical protein